MHKPMLLLFALLAFSSASAGTHKLTSATDTSTDVMAVCPGWGTVRVEMVAIASVGQAGGQDATSISITLEGTVDPADIALVSVLYGGSAVNYTAPPQVGAPFTLALPDLQKGGVPWTVVVYVAETAAGKTFRLTVNGIAGTNNAYLPFSTAGRYVGTPTCE